VEQETQTAAAEFVADIRAARDAEIIKEIDKWIAQTKTMLKSELTPEEIERKYWKARLDELEHFKEWIEG